jgi:glycosyltransferase involved in cell wall biosynthesis
MHNKIKITVIITNYNYKNYISEAIDSVLKQTYKYIEIIIVDDGSTDGSQEIIKKKYSKNKKIKIITKKNGGQLSAFNEAFKYINGEIVFFLDADDTYNKTYIKKAVDYYNKNNFCDFLFCNKKFINKESVPIPPPKKTVNILPKKEFYGYTPVITYLNKLWIGASTSCISMRQHLLTDIIPIPFEKDWKIRADDCLVWGASLKFGYKCYLDESLVNYRIHENNSFFGKKIKNKELYLRNLKIEKLFAFLYNNTNILSIQKKIALEFKFLPIKTKDDLIIYLKALIKSKINIFYKMKNIISIIIAYIKK